jgi:hypothetical protein
MTKRAFPNATQPGNDAQQHANDDEPNKKPRTMPRVVVYDFSGGCASDANGPRGDQSKCPPLCGPGDENTGETVATQEPAAASVCMEAPTPPTSPVTGPLPQSPQQTSANATVSPSPKVFCEINRTVETIEDLIAVGKLYEEPDYSTKKYSVNVAGIHRMIPALEEFQSMIGMDSIKRQVVDQIIYLSGTKNHSQFSQQMAVPKPTDNSNTDRQPRFRRPQQRPPSQLALPPSTTATSQRITHIRPLSQKRTHHTPLRSVRNGNSDAAAGGGGSGSSVSTSPSSSSNAPSASPTNSTTASTLLSQLFSGLAGAQQKGRGGRSGGATGPRSSQQFSSSESVTHADTAHDMFHTVIYGPPGVGKTAFAKILARLFLNLGITQNDTFRVARRSDLIGEYVGHTATKTQKVIDEAMGGVLFIDEVYSLGNGAGENKNPASKSDSFSTECINTLNQNLTERKGEFVCIIAGYKKETEKQFFDLNPGLRRRFSFQYTIDAYDWKELTRILLYKIEQLDGWDSVANLGQQLLEDTELLKEHMDDFPHYAGDVETWLLHIKIAHCKRVFGKHESIQRLITFADVEAGLGRYREQKRDADKEKRREQAASMRHLYM